MVIPDAAPAHTEGFAEASYAPSDQQCEPPVQWLSTTVAIWDPLRFQQFLKHHPRAQMSPDRDYYMWTDVVISRDISMACSARAPRHHYRQSRQVILLGIVWCLAVMR